MTDIEPAASTALATPDPEAIEGLEDFDNATDGQMPMIRIDHDNGVFIDGLSNEPMNAAGQPIDVVLLGLIKQRVLWPVEVADDAHPLCKSYNFLEGHPDPDKFPLRASGFAASDIEAGTLPCADCKLKDWDSHPQREVPWCTEQHTFALLTGNAADGWSPALLTLQRSGIKPSRQYLTAFARDKQPLYTIRTRITLDQRRRGSVDFAVPKFVKGESTDESEWPIFATNYRSIRTYVQTPRSSEESTDDTVTETPVAEPTVAAPAAAPAAAAPAAPDPTPAAAPAPAPAAAAPVDDDLPF